MSGYISVRKISEKWKISERRVQKLCEQTRIKSVEHFRNYWMIPRLAKSQMVCVKRMYRV